MQRLEAWRSVATAVGVVALACDGGGEASGVPARSAADPPTSAGTQPAPTSKATGTSPQDSPRWPAKAGESGQAFTAGIVEHKAVPRAVALLTDVRSARHAGFDRIVFEFGSGSPPGYHLEYIDKPVRQCGSGEVTTIAGDGWLEVRFEPADAHTPSGAPTIAKRDQKVDLEVVKELEQTCDFEAQVTWVLGVRRPNKYRVLALNQPVRLVVDVQH
jgi:hypothetical protein